MVRFISEKWRIYSNDGIFFKSHVLAQQIIDLLHGNQAATQKLCNEKLRYGESFFSARLSRSGTTRVSLVF